MKRKWMNKRNGYLEENNVIQSKTQVLRHLLMSWRKYCIPMQRSVRPVFKVQDLDQENGRDRDWRDTVSTCETETLIHEYSRLRPGPGKCVFSRPRSRPRPGKWLRPRLSLIFASRSHNVNLRADRTYWSRN